MRVIVIAFAMLLSLPGLAAAQPSSPQASVSLAVAERGGVEWREFSFLQDGISVNFPSPPTITETTWTSQLRYTLPARVYSVENGPERYSMTVVDYRPLEEQGIARWKACPPGNSQCRNGGETIGPGYWKQDERGAPTFALSRYMKDQRYKITDFAWDWQDMVEGYHLQLDGPGDRRTLVYVAMHLRKLYILEASSPAHYPEPGLFQQSIGWLDENGKRIRYTETVYSNSYHGLGVYPRPQYRISGE